MSTKQPLNAKQQYCTHKLTTQSEVTGAIIFEGSAMRPVNNSRSILKCFRCGFTRQVGDPDPTHPHRSTPKGDAASRRGRRQLVSEEQLDMFGVGA